MREKRQPIYCTACRRRLTSYVLPTQLLPPCSEGIEKPLHYSNADTVIQMQTLSIDPSVFHVE